jgi:hypothetical protein
MSSMEIEFEVIESEQPLGHKGLQVLVYGCTCEKSVLNPFSGELVLHI